MPLLEHLTEHRARLLRCSVALLIGITIAWNYSETLLTFVERPLTGHTYLIEEKAKVAQAMQQHFPGVYDRFNLTAYVNVCLRLLLIFGLVFELPVVAAILARLGLIAARFLARQRKFAVLASAIVATFRADLITMVVIWIPLYLMYEVSLWTARVFWRTTGREVAGAL